MTIISYICMIFVFIARTALGGGVAVYRSDHSETVANKCGFLIQIDTNTWEQILADGEKINFQTHMEKYATHRGHPGSWKIPFNHSYTTGLHCLLMLKLSAVGDSLENTEQKEHIATIEDLSVGGVPFDVGHPVEGFIFKESELELEEIKPDILTSFLNYFIKTVVKFDEVQLKLQHILQGKNAKVLIGYKRFRGELKGEDMGEYLLLACIVQQLV